MVLIFALNQLCGLLSDRCQLWEKDTESKEMKEQIKELVVLLRQSELRRKEVEKDLKNKDQAASVAMETTPSVWFPFILS